MLSFFQVCFILGTCLQIANANPVGISISGKIVEESTDQVLTGPVAFRVKVLSKDNCILYSEEFTTTLSSTGTFTFTLGKGANSVNAYYPSNPVAGQSVTGMNKLFSNLQPAAVTSLGNGAASGSPMSSDNVACPGTYTPAADDYRKVRIEFDNGDSQGYRAIMPYHQIRTVPYAMIAEEAGNSEKLGGVAASDYAKMTDLPDLATGVPAAETDPSVKAFAKADITGVSGTSCPAGYVLTLDNNVVKCVVDGGSGAAYTLPVATDSVLGGVMVPSASDIAIDGSGNLTLKALATSKITGLDTALTGTVKYTDMPGTSCGAGQALVWTSPANTFTCYTLTIAQSQVTNLTTDLAAKLPLAGGTMTGDLNMGGKDVLATGHITMSNQKTITVGKYDQTQENTLAGTLTGANEGATWYNTAMKSLRFWDGSARQTVVSTTAACSDGQILKWNDTTKVWACSADSGAGGADASSIRGTDVSTVAPTTTGQVMRYNSVTSKWEASGIQASDLPNSIARSKVAAGTADHVLINDGSGNLSSEAQLAISRGGTGQSTYTDGQVLIGKTDGTLAKSTITAGSGVTITNGDGTITIAATGTAPSDASYTVKGIVQLLTNAATSGLNVSSGVISVNSGTAANQIVQLDGSARLPAVDGSALTNLTVPADKVTSAAGKYFTYAPNGAACTNGEILKKTANGWECAADATGTSPGDASYAAKGIVQFNTDADTSGVSVASGVATLNTGTTANKIVKLDGSAKLPAVDGSALTNLDVSHIASATGKYLSYLPNGVACADGGVLKWDNSNTRWICGADAGSGGADASSIRGQAVDGVATAGIGNFMQHDGTKWTFVSMPQCTADKVLTFSAIGVATCENIAGLTNSAIAAGAAIDRTKVASGTANHVVINNGSGVLSSEAQLAVSRGGTGQSTYTDGQVLIGKTDGTLAKSTITAGSGVTVTNGDGTITIAATATAPSDASYSVKGIVQLLTNASTSGLNVSSGVISVNSGTGADQLVKLDGTAKLPAVDGSALTNVTVSADKVTSAAGKYFTYAPNGAACTNGEVLKKTANGWECAADATGTSPGDASYAAKGIVQFNTDADTSGVSVASGVATLNTGTTANKIVKLDGSAKLPAVDGSALTNLDVSHIASASGKYLSYLPNGAACADGGVLKWDNSNSRWICGTDAGAGGADASSIRGQVVDGVATAGIGNFMQHDGTKWTFVSMPQCTADKVLTFSAIGVATCENIAGLTNSAIAAGAAIDRTKVALGTANHVVINNGSGVLSSEAQLAVSRGGTGQSTYTDGQVLIGKTDGTLAKSTITAGSGVTVTNGDGTITIAATATAPSDASYSVKGIVQLLTNASTSGLNVSSGVISVNSGTAADQLVKLDGSAKLPAVDGSALTNVTVSADKVTSGVGKYFTYAPNGAACTNGEILKKTANGWECAADATGSAPGDSSYAAKGIVQFNTDADTSGVSVASGVATLNTGTTANKIVKLDGSAKLPAVDGSALTNLDATKITSGVLPVARGGTGQSTFTDGQILIGKTDGTLAKSTLTAGTNVTITNADGAITINAGGGSDTLSGLSCASGDVASWNGSAWVCQTTGSTNVASSIVKRSPSNAISAGVSDFTGVRIFDGVSGYITLQTPATVTSYSLTLPTGTGTNGQMLTTNGSGVLSWSTPAASLPGLASTNMWVGNGSGVATAVAMSGDTTMDNAGAVTIGASKVNSSKILDDSIMNADINSSAAIARSKIANGTAYAIATHNASGTLGNGIACSTTGHVLAWNGTQFACSAPSASLPALSSANLWVGNGSSVATAVAASGDVTLANTGAFTVTKMQGRSISSSAPSAGQVLMYISSTWTPTSPTTSGAVSSLLQLDASGVATSIGNAIKGATTGTATIQAPNSFTSYSLTLPADDGNANQVLTTNGSGTLTWTTPGGAPTITTKSADFTVSTGEDNYFYMISNATTATLPAVASVPAGFRATFKRIGGSNVNIIASGAETIDGANQRALSSTYQTIALINTGTEWAIIGGGATGTVSGCVPGSQSYPGAGTYTLNVDADRASKCKFTVTVQGAGGGNGSSGGNGGRGGALSLVYTAPGAGAFEIYVGSPGLSSSNGGSGGGGTGGLGSSQKGGGGGGASAIRWTTTAPTDVLLAIAGGGGGGASTGLNGGGNGGGVIAATNGQTTASTEGGKAGGSNVGGAAGTGSANGGAGGSSVGAGSSGAGTPAAAGGSAVAAFSISGGGGGATSSLQGCGAGGGGYGGGGGGAVGSSIYGGGGGGGGYVNSGALDSFTSMTGPAAGTSGSVLIEWN